jgi:hypothetical protein
VIASSPSRPRRGAVFAAAVGLVGEALGVLVAELQFVDGEGVVKFATRPLDTNVDQAIAAAGRGGLNAIFGDGPVDSAFAQLLRDDPLVSELVKHVARRLATQGALSREELIGMVGGSRLALRRIRLAALPTITQEVPECTVR